MKQKVSQVSEGFSKWYKGEMRGGEVMCEVSGAGGAEQGSW